MRITDYEGGKTLRDVAITLTRDEAEELAAYLHRLMGTPSVRHAHLSAVRGAHLDQELTIAIESSDRSNHPAPVG
jgi:hypothetical protein